MRDYLRLWRSIAVAALFVGAIWGVISSLSNIPWYIHLALLLITITIALVILSDAVDKQVSRYYILDPSTNSICSGPLDEKAALARIQDRFTGGKGSLLLEVASYSLHPGDTDKARIDFPY